MASIKYSPGASLSTQYSPDASAHPVHSDSRPPPTAGNPAPSVLCAVTPPLTGAPPYMTVPQILPAGVSETGISSVWPEPNATFTSLTQ